NKINQKSINNIALLLKQQRDLQKAINAHKVNGRAFAKKAIEATKNAEISGSKIVGNGAIKTFSNRATAVMGVISMGDA
ncbi:hypothetical protein QG070_10170, partial [Kingella kingae]|uniref:hypothetical protein n=1 Tax=Kingella kingae TaxID=504 RepID=UPI0025502049